MGYYENIRLLIVLIFLDKLNLNTKDQNKYGHKNSIIKLANFFMMNCQKCSISSSLFSLASKHVRVVSPLSTSW